MLAVVKIRRYIINHTNAIYEKRDLWLEFVWLHRVKRPVILLQRLNEASIIFRFVRFTSYLVVSIVP